MIDQDDFEGIGSVKNKYLQGALFYVRICEDLHTEGFSKDLLSFSENYRESEKEDNIE